ncbi:MAG: HAD-IA family hydrolase [Verrucomicrobiota bacterium]
MGFATVEPMKARCVVFDFDGTIADTIEQALIILNKLSTEYGFNELQAGEIAGAKDMTARQFIRHLKVPRLKVPVILHKGKKMLTEHIQNVQPCPGMVELIKTTRQDYEIVGILTSNSQENVEKFLKAHGIDVFDFISTISKLSGKAKSLKAIMRTFNLKPKEVIFVGDELRDIKAAKKATVPVAAVTWGFNSEKSIRHAEPTYVVNEIQTLRDILYHVHEEDEDE